MNAPHLKPKSSSGKRAINVTLDKDAIAGAKEMGINISQACEAGLLRELKAVREEKWIAENWDAIQSFNEYVANNGIPLAKYRQF